MKKKEQFNLALWDRLKKDNIPHTFETREGSVITQLKVFYTAKDQQIIGYDNIDDSIERWTINGVYYNDTTKDSDLFIVWEEEQLMLEGWVNVYNNGLFAVYTTRKEADDYAASTRIACVKVFIPYTKGEGLENG